MLESTQILAASQGESELTKVIIGAVFFLFWVLSSIASAISKKKEQEKRLKARDAIQNAGVSLPPPLPGTARQQTIRRTTQRPQAVRQAPKLQKQPQKQQQRRFASKAPRPLPPKPARPVAPLPVAATHLPTQAPLSASEIAGSANVPRKPTAPATATAIRAWLRPTTLRQQFMLTEVLQPPIALREPRDR